MCLIVMMVKIIFLSGYWNVAKDFQSEPTCFLLWAVWKVITFKKFCNFLIRSSLGCQGIGFSWIENNGAADFFRYGYLWLYCATCSAGWWISVCCICLGSSEKVCNWTINFDFAGMVVFHSACCREIFC